MKKILVTGFIPFNGRDVNPSELIVNALEAPENTMLIKMILPVEFHRAERLLAEKVESERPDCILSIGQAGNAPYIAVEQVAVNMDSSLSADGKNILPDQAGYTPKDTKILVDGPDAYFSTLPVRDLVAAASAAGIPARVSYSAGTYVCNHIMYVGAHLASRYGKMISGFVHVPFLLEQLSGNSDKCNSDTVNSDTHNSSTGNSGKCNSGVGARYGMPFEDMRTGVQAILCKLAEYI